MDKIFVKFLLPALIFTILGNSNLFSQLPDSNTILIRHLNSHPQGGIYSACWGYRAPNGREYAIIGCFRGTQFVDITDSANIHEVGFFRSIDTNSFYNEWKEMKVYSHYAYIVSELPNTGVQIIDLQYLPDSIHFVRRFTFGSFDHAHTIQQDGPYLYINGGNVSVGQSDPGGTTVLDLTADPTLPVVRGSWGVSYDHDCRVRHDTIFAANIYNPPGTISVINAANKDNLQTINSWINSPNPGPHNCALTTDGRYCLVTDEIGGNPRYLKIWNIQNLSNVVFVASWHPANITTSIIHNVEVYGNYAVIAHYAAGIRIVDITNPAAPQEAAWYDTYPSGNQFDYVGCWGVFMFPSGKIIGSDMQSGLYVIRTSFNIVGENNNSSQVPKTFSLKQNYPNPFNPSTVIEYDVPKNSYVKLKVYNSLGQLVGTLVDAFEYAGGHMVTYDASRLPSGIYFYRMESEGFSMSKKMVLAK